MTLPPLRSPRRCGHRSATAATCSSLSCQPNDGMPGAVGSCVGGDAARAAQDDADQRGRIVGAHHRATPRATGTAAARPCRRARGRPSTDRGRSRAPATIAGSSARSGAGCRAGPAPTSDRSRSRCRSSSVMCELDSATSSAIGPVAALIAVVAGLQIGDDIVGRPAAEAAAVVIGDVGREPALQVRAVQISRWSCRRRETIFGVWQAPQCAGPCDQERAAIPFGGLVADRA